MIQPSARHVRLAGESLQVMAGQALAVVGSLWLLRALSQQLQPAAFGVLALGLTGSLLVSQAISGGTTAAIGRFFCSAQEAGTVATYLEACSFMLWRDQTLTAALAVISAVVFGLVLGPAWMFLALGAGCMAIATSWFSALVALVTSGRHRLAASALTALDSWLKLLFLSVCWHWLPADPAQTLLLYGCSTALLALAAGRLLQPLLGEPLRIGPIALDTTRHQWCRQMLAFARPFTRFGLITWLQQSSDRWALQLWAGPISVGEYAVVYQLGYSPMGILSNALTTLVAPILYARAGDASDQQRSRSAHQLLRRLTVLGLLLSASATGLALLVHRWLFGLLVSPVYQQLSVWFPWMVLAGTLFAVGQLIALGFMTDSRTADLSRVKSLTALLGVGFNALGAGLAGLAGVVVAQNLFAAVYLLCMLHLGLRADTTHAKAHG